MPRKPGHAGTKEADPPWATLPERRRCAIDNKIKGLRVFWRAAPEPGVALRRWWLLGHRLANPRPSHDRPARFPADLLSYSFDTRVRACPVPDRGRLPEHRARPLPGEAHSR